MTGQDRGSGISVEVSGRCRDRIRRIRPTASGRSTRRPSAARRADDAPARDPAARARASRGSSRACGGTAIAALLAFARRFDGLDRAARGDARRDRARRRAYAARRARRDSRWRRDTSRASRAGRSRAAGRSARSPACVEQRVVPLDRVGCYVPGGRYPLPSSLLMTAIPARVAGVREIIAVCPRPDADGHVRGARSGRRPAVPPRRRARDRRARLRHRDGPARGQDRRARQRVRRGRQGARRRRLRDRLLRRPERDRRRLGHRPCRLDRRRPDRAGRARSGRARDPHHAVEAAGAAPSRARVARQMPADRPGAGRRSRATAASS